MTVDDIESFAGFLRMMIGWYLDDRIVYFQMPMIFHVCPFWYWIHVNNILLFTQCARVFVRTKYIWYIKTVNIEHPRIRLKCTSSSLKNMCDISVSIAIYYTRLRLRLLNIWLTVDSSSSQQLVTLYKINCCVFGDIIAIESDQKWTICDHVLTWEINFYHRVSLS